MLPAYAGMIRGDTLLASETRRAPRVCGDDPTRPRARYQPEAVLPAYAGMILPGVEDPPQDGGAPRVCGDDPPSCA